MDDINNQQQPSTPAAQPNSDKTNVMAILSLIFAFLFPLLGVIFGIVALVQIKKNPAQKGKGLAIAGIIVGGLAILLFFIIFIGMISYFGVLAPDKFLPSKCMIAGGFSCSEYQIRSGRVSVSIQNNLGIDAEQVKIGLIDSNGRACSSSTGSDSIGSMANGFSKTVVFDGGCDLTSSMFDGDLTINYVKSGTTYSSQTTGAISGRLEQ